MTAREIIRELRQEQAGTNSSEAKLAFSVSRQIVQRFIASQEALIKGKDDVNSTTQVSDELRQQILGEEE